MTNRQLARTVFWASILMLVGMVLLALVLPQFQREWAEQGESLSSGAALLVALGSLSKEHGRWVMPLLLIGAIGSTVWGIVSGRRHEKTATPGC